MTSLWYSLRLVFFPLRLSLYWLHSIIVFIARPGAKIVIPLFLLVIGLALRTVIDPLLGGAITQAAAPFVGTALFDFRIEIAFAILFMAVYVLMWLAATVLSPVAGTFPAPQKPLPPMRALRVPKHVVSKTSASIAVRKPVKGYFNGNLVRLTKRLPPDIKTLLEAKERDLEATALPPLPDMSPPAPPPSAGRENMQLTPRPMRPPPANPDTAPSQQRTAPPPLPPDPHSLAEPRQLSAQPPQRPPAPQRPPLPPQERGE